MRRYHVTLGAYTTVGGVVVSASSTSFINGKAIPLEGDLISCPSCKSTGYIVCTGPRIPEFENGKPLALENDFCVCGCVPPPRLIANQSLSFHTIEGGGEPVHAYIDATYEGGHANVQFDDRFVIRDSNGVPMVNLAYAIERATGEIEYGETDDQGHTHILSATAASENIKIYIAG